MFKDLYTAECTKKKNIALQQSTRERERKKRKKHNKLTAHRDSLECE